MKGDPGITFLLPFLIILAGMGELMLVLICQFEDGKAGVVTEFIPEPLMGMWALGLFSLFMGSVMMGAVLKEEPKEKRIVLS